MAAPIEVLAVRRVEGHGSLRAFVTVQLGAIVLHGVRVIQQPAWVARRHVRLAPDRALPGVDVDDLDVRPGQPCTATSNTCWGGYG